MAKKRETTLTTEESAATESGATPSARILVVDDEETVREVIRQVLTMDGHDVATAENGEAALQLFKSEPFPLVITDIVLRGITGLDVLREVKALSPDTLVVMMTSHASVETAAQAMRTGAYDYLTKPFDELEIVSNVVKRALDKIRLADENTRLWQDLRRKAHELEQINQSLQRMAYCDGLTGLYNQRYFRAALEQEIVRSVRHSHKCCLIMADIDNFKKFNDTYGHPAGDEALRLIARVLSNNSRAFSVTARYGGEEFAVLVPETDKAGALVVAERLRADVAAQLLPGKIPGSSVRVTLSLGVASFPDQASEPNGLIDAADKALYEAKRAGRNRVCG